MLVKEKYQKPQSDVQTFKGIDVITTSGTNMELPNIDIED